MNLVTGIELSGVPSDPTLDFRLDLRGGGRVIGKLPAKHGYVVWAWALEIVGSGGMVDLQDLLPDAAWAAFVPEADG